MRIACRLLVSLACFGFAAGAVPAAAQQSSPPPGLHCVFDYTAVASFLGSDLEGTGTCLTPEGTIVNARIDGQQLAGWGWECAPAWSFSVTSGETQLLTGATWYTTTHLTIPRVASGPVTSTTAPGQGTALSVGTGGCVPVRHGSLLNDSGKLVLTFLS